MTFADKIAERDVRVSSSGAAVSRSRASAFDFDVAIVGAGPAGAASALYAARSGVRVALFEPQHGPIDKPCGEGVMPAGVDVLCKLGLHDAIARGQSFAGLRFFLPRSAPLDIPLPRAGVAIERPVLQAALDAAIAIERNVTRFTEHVDAVRGASERRVANSAHGFVVRTKTQELRVRTLVAADGLNGKCAAWLRSNEDSTRLRSNEDSARLRSNEHATRSVIGTKRLGIRLRFEAREPLDRVEIHFGDACEIYLTPLTGGRVNAVVLVDIDERTRSGDAHSIADAVLSRHPLPARHLGRCITDAEARVLMRRRPRIVAEAGAFLVGDAGGGVDPILGCGTTIALVSGLDAARAVCRIVDEDAHRIESRGTAERAYARGYGRATRLRRPLAAFLLTLARRPALARATATITRASPLLQNVLVRLAAGS